MLRKPKRSKNEVVAPKEEEDISYLLPQLRIHIRTFITLITPNVSCSEMLSNSPSATCFMGYISVESESNFIQLIATSPAIRNIALLHAVITNSTEQYNYT